MAQSNDMAAKLRALSERGATPADEGAATPAAAATSNFTDPKTDAEKEALRAQRMAKNSKNSDVTTRIMDTAVKADTPQGTLMKTISQNARIAGYIVKNGAKVDFFQKRRVEREKGADGKMHAIEGAPVTYDIGIKQTPPSKIEGVIVSYPAKALTALMNQDYTADAVAAATDDVTSMVVKIEKMPEMPAILTSRAAGYLVEAKEIFDPYVSKKLNIASYGDAPQVFKNLPQKPCLYASLKLGQITEGTETLYRVKHSYRARIATPRNIIALNMYETTPVKDVYSDAEAKEMIELYLSKWTRSNKGTPVIEQLTPDCRKNFELNRVGDAVVIEKTRFFPTDMNESWYKENTVAHWYERTAVGDARALSRGELALVKKHPSQKPGANARPVVRALKGPDASADAYRFEPQGAHKAIVDATGGKLSFDDIITFTPASNRTRSANSNVPTTLVGTQLMGTDADTVRQILMGSFGVKQK